MEETPIQPVRRVKMPSSPDRSSSKAGTIRAISRAGCSRWSYMGMSRARRTCGEVFATGCPSCIFVPPDRRRSSTATSDTGSLTPPATPISTRICPAGPTAELDRYIGYWKPYATSNADLDADAAIQDEVRNAARTLLDGVRAKLEGKLVAGEELRPPRQK